MTRALLFASALLLWASPAAAQQQPPPCRFLCDPQLKIEPTGSMDNAFGAPRVRRDDGTIARAPRDASFELVLAAGVHTPWSWLDLTTEAIIQPFDRGGSPELEFEANLIWLPSRLTGGWVSSHADIVDKFSPAERSSDRSAYTHKLNLELDTAVAVFNWLPDGRWLKGVELELSLDYVATGLAKAGDPVDRGQLLDAASPWSIAVVVVLPLAGS